MEDREEVDPIPEDGEFETARLTITSFIRPDGSQGYGVHARGDAPMTTFLGLTIVAQEHIKKWGSKPTDVQD